MGLVVLCRCAVFRPATALARIILKGAKPWGHPNGLVLPGGLWIVHLIAAVSAIAQLGCGVAGLEAAKARREVVPKNWSIGVLSGEHLTKLTESKSCSNPVLSAEVIKSPASAFVADPFVIRRGGAWLLFFESFSKDTNKGEIGVATSRDLCRWRFLGMALKEPFHLSYPFVFKDGGRYYMVPESRQAGEIRLYRATSFPLRWRYERTLVRGNYSDPSAVRFNNRWWIFANRAPYALAIFSAASLRGEFREHPLSPLNINDASIARPAGRPIVLDGRLIRFVQDNREGYGRRVRAVEVSELSEERYSERVISPDPFLSGDGDGWNGYGMHHIDPMRTADKGWIAVVDGNRVSP